MTMHREWGVKHSQGIRRESSERAARESLEGMLVRYERSFRAKIKPHIVHRQVSDWEPFNSEEPSE